jgi:uncharacterized phiE125 gp8 family phage protein
VRADHREEDALIGAYLASAIEHAEAFTRRPLLPGTYEAEATMPGTRAAVPLPCPPGAAAIVERVEYEDASGAVIELAPEAYEVRAGDEPELRPAPGSYWPLEAWGRSVRVRYAVEYSDGQVPADSVRVAVLLLAGHWYANRESVIVGTISSEAPHGVEMLLWPHRRLLFA